MSDEAIFSTTATAHGGRAGHITTDDYQLEVELSIPKALGGPGGDGTNPEQLFAAGYAACFQSALEAVARQSKLDVSDSTVTGKVSLYRTVGGGYKLGVELQAKLPGIDRATAENLMKQANVICPYSNATRDNIDVVLTLVEDAA